MSESELKEIFFLEATQILEELDQNFTALEKDTSNSQYLESIFRVTHTLKANAAAMGYQSIADMSHLMEDIFNQIRQKPELLTESVFNDLFRANDKLREMIEGLKTDEKISYHGLKTRLNVILKGIVEDTAKTENTENKKEPTLEQENTKEILEESTLQPNSGESELKEVFFSEATQILEELDQNFTALENDTSSTQYLESIFREIHTLKANAAAMGYQSIADMSHLMEDIFNQIRQKSELLTESVFNDLFRANDKLREMIESLKTDEKVSYHGLKTRLKVILRNISDEDEKQKESISQKEEEKETSVESENLQTIQKETKIEKPPVQESATKVIEKTQHLFSEHISIPVKKLDNLLNLVEELTIERDRILTISQKQKNGIHSELSRLKRVTSELQYSVMNARLIPVDTLFRKFHRIVRDVAQKEGKKVNLILEGTEIEIDRNILQIISDSLIHLVRNGISHGLETEAERNKKEKSPTGVLKLKAYNEKDSVYIEVTDDGNGIDIPTIQRKILEKGLVEPHQIDTLSQEDIIDFIFLPGFSSAANLSEISGRGIGMDVVKKSIQSVGGRIHIQTQRNQGTTFQLILPSSMAVKPSLLFRVQSEIYAIPISYTEAVIQKPQKDIFIAGETLICNYLEKTIPLIYLEELLEISLDKVKKSSIQLFQREADTTDLTVVIISDGSKLLGLVVNELLEQKDLIEKPLKAPLQGLQYISGATILGNGQVSLVLDAPDILMHTLRVGAKAEKKKF